MLPEVPPSGYAVRQVGWQLLDGNSSGLKTWGYSAEIPAELLEVFSRQRSAKKERKVIGAERERPRERPAAALRDYQVAGVSVRLVYVFLRGRTKNGFCPSPQKTQPQLFLTPRVKRRCDEWVLPFAGSVRTEGLYIRAVVRDGREYSVGMSGTRVAVSAEGVRSGPRGLD